MRTPGHRHLLRVLGLTLLAFLTPPACKKLDQIDLPSTNPNPPQAPLPPAQPTGSVIIGQPSPPPGATPPPGSSPTPAPGSPTPTPASTPSANSCALPQRPDGSPCAKETPSFQAQLEAAQADVLRTRPDLFSGGSVRSEDDYVQEVARVLRTKGLCAAQGGPPDEIAIKTTNDWNDQYDIVLGSGQPWTSYQVTCRPARF